MDRDKAIDQILNGMAYVEEYDPEFLYTTVDPVRERYGRYEDFKACIDEMVYENLVEWTTKIIPGKLINHHPFEMKSPEMIPLVTLTIKAKRIKEAGGWIKVKRKEKVKSLVAGFVMYGTFFLALVGVLLQWHEPKQQFQQPIPADTSGVLELIQKPDYSIPKLDSLLSDSTLTAK